VFVGDLEEAHEVADRIVHFDRGSIERRGEALAVTHAGT
jgi:simple sugar transport system ATP-binding protein